MRADRLLSIMLLLQTRGRMTASELANYLEVSERTIYRDLDALSVAGVPVYGEHGPGGGYALLESYRADLTGLTEAEVRSLFMSGVIAPLKELGLGEVLKAALLKLTAALPESHRSQAEQSRHCLHLDPTWWFQPAEIHSHLQILQNATWNNQRIFISYHRGDGSAGERIVDPYGLVAKSGMWYLVAWIGDAMRVYRISRIQSVALVDAVFTRPADFDLAAFWADWVREFETMIQESQYRVTLRVATNMRSRLPQLWGEAYQDILAVPPDADGWTTIDCLFDNFDDALRAVLSLGAQIRVVAPDDLREAVIEYAAAMARLYSS